jgi:dihydrofolate reductase
VLAKGKLTDEIERLKSKPGKDMIVYGGAGFVASLIKENLIGEFYLYVNPVALGGGSQLFQDVTNRLPLLLVSVKSYDCGMAVLQYALKK